MISAKKLAKHRIFETKELKDHEIFRTRNLRFTAFFHNPENKDHEFFEIKNLKRAGGAIKKKQLSAASKNILDHIM